MPTFDSFLFDEATFSDPFSSRWRYRSGASSALASAYSIADTTLTVLTGEGVKFSDLSAGGVCYVRLGNALGTVRKVISISGDVLTLAPGAAGRTTDQAAIAAMTVDEVITEESLDQFKIDVRSGFGPLWALVDPTTQSWAWVNQGAATAAATDVGGSPWLVLSAPSSGSRNLRMLVVPAPTAPYTVTCAVILTLPFGSSTPFGGLVFRDSSTGKAHPFGVYSSAGSCSLAAKNWSSATAPVSDIVSPVSVPQPTGMLWLRIADNATNKVFSYSFDGITFVTFASEARATYCTPDQVGFFAEGNGVDAATTLASFTIE